MSGERSETRTLSTGHVVDLPLELDARITGAVFSVPLDRLRATLPDGLRPLRLTPRRGGLTVLSVDYERIGDDAMPSYDAMPPYDEVSVQIPAVAAGTTTAPVVSGWLNAVNGYVLDMPVSTAPARALGREVWGYPKDVADISIDHGDSRTRTEVRLDGDSVLSLAVKRPPTVPMRRAGFSYTETDGTLLRERTTVDGRVGAWPLTDEVSVSAGAPGRDYGRWIDGRSRALLRLAGDVRMTIGAGTVVSR